IFLVVIVAFFLFLFFFIYFQILQNNFKKNEEKVFQQNILQINIKQPMERPNTELLSPADLNGELNKLYLSSREKLHVITENPSENMLNSISHCMKRNSKFLTECFNTANAYRYEIVDMVTERLSCQDVDDTSIPKTTDSKHVDSFLSTNRNYYNEKQWKKRKEDGKKESREYH
ncbi:hypothetical protein DOY81_007211, partial [Sarcophaga bullata]